MTRRKRLGNAPGLPAGAVADADGKGMTNDPPTDVFSLKAENKRSQPRPEGRGKDEKTCERPARSHPLFLTFTTYGTWLHGDERGSHNRKGNTFAERFPAPDPALIAQMKLRMKHAEYRLGDAARECVHAAITEHCAFKGWILHALNVRTNHVHLVVTAQGLSGARVLNEVKAWATRALRKREFVAQDQPAWTERGSKVVLDSPEGFAAAVHYVKFGQ